MTIITNNHWRELIYAHELTSKEREEFDVDQNDENESRSFVRYRGCLYDISDFVTTSPGPWNHGLPDEFKKWAGYASDSFFSGVLIRFDRDCEHVQLATYLS